jgi:hypothetical protein
MNALDPARLPRIREPFSDSSAYGPFVHITCGFDGHNVPTYFLKTAARKSELTSAGDRSPLSGAATGCPGSIWLEDLELPTIAQQPAPATAEGRAEGQRYNAPR